MTKQLHTWKVLQEASDLVSEEGENVEYDRALVELTMRLTDAPEGNRDWVAYLIGVKSFVGAKTKDRVGLPGAYVLDLAGWVHTDDQSLCDGGQWADRRGEGLDTYYTCLSHGRKAVRRRDEPVMSPVISRGEFDEWCKYHCIAARDIDYLMNKPHSSLWRLFTQIYGEAVLQQDWNRYGLVRAVLAQQYRIELTAPIQEEGEKTDGEDEHGEQVIDQEADPRYSWRCPWINCEATDRNTEGAFDEHISDEHKYRLPTPVEDWLE